MSWIRLDDGFATNPKIVALTDRELRVWVRVLCYAARLQDPTVDRITIREVPGLTPKTLCRFESLSLLDRVGNSYEIHHWTDYQPKDKTGAERQARYRARRLEQAEQPRNATVTETVTPDRYENVTSRARGSRPVPEKEPPSVLPTEPNHDGGTDGEDIDFQNSQALLHAAMQARAL